jgi:Ca2+-binding RTX toxin-like protein
MTAALVALTVALLALPSAALTEGTIVVKGPAYESHLRLSVEGSDVIVTGQFARVVGCEVLEGHRSARCSTDGVGAMEIEMGPADDKVEVGSPLPVPLTVRLGSGSDKFLGNDEDDTCYSEGSKKNRCLGGGGDDICITGPENSDCVGAEGNDYCKHLGGSDGCFGGPGDDICDMGSGKDGCHAGPGDDRLEGGPDPDQLYGGSGNDYCDGGSGTGMSHQCEKGPGD